MKIVGWIIFGFCAIGIGLYPLIYAIAGSNVGLLQSKSSELLADDIWRTAFYLHISFGGIALLSGWTQFSKRIRNRKRFVHHLLGKTYVTVVLISGLSGLYIAAYANGEIISQLGFSGLAIAWLITTIQAFRLIRAGKIDQHQHWMIRSYALTFASVTLRVWLPLSQIAGLEFILAYKIIAWFCWVPNLIVAELLVTSMRNPAVVRANS